MKVIAIHITPAFISMIKNHYNVSKLISKLVIWENDRLKFVTRTKYYELLVFHSVLLLFHLTVLLLVSVCLYSVLFFGSTDTGLILVFFNSVVFLVPLTLCWFSFTLWCYWFNCLTHCADISFTLRCNQLLSFCSFFCFFHSLRKRFTDSGILIC